MPDLDRPAPLLPWWLITCGTLGVLGLYLALVLTTSGQTWDNAVMDRAGQSPSLQQTAETIVHQLGPQRMVILCLMACLSGLVRSWRIASGAAVATIICLLLPQVLKATLPRPQLADPWPMANSLPSGHTAAVAALTVALALVLGPPWRRVVLLVGALATGLMGVLVIVLAYHRPSDVLASMALAVAAAGAGLLVQGRGRPRGGREAQAWPRALGGSLGGHSPSSEPSSMS